MTGFARMTTPIFPIMDNLYMETFFFANFLNLPTEEKTTEISAEKLSATKEILSPNFIFIWLIFMFNVVAGMIFISFQSPLLQDL